MSKPLYFLGWLMLAWPAKLVMTVIVLAMIVSGVKKERPTTLTFNAKNCQVVNDSYVCKK